MLRIITNMDVITIRATSAPLPGYGASSFLRNSLNQANRAFEFGGVCAIVAISTPTNYYHGRLAHSKQLRRRIFNPHANRKAGCEMNPIQRPLDVRQARRQAANYVRVRGHAEPNAIHHARESYVRFGHDIHVSAHSRRDAL